MKEKVITRRLTSYIVNVLVYNKQESSTTELVISTDADIDNLEKEICRNLHEDYVFITIMRKVRLESLYTMPRKKFMITAEQGESIYYGEDGQQITKKEAMEYIEGWKESEE